MKKLICMLLALMLCLAMLPAMADDDPAPAPANPNSQPATVTYVSSGTEGGELVVPAPDQGADSIEVVDEDAMLTEEMIAQLDAEVQDMLVHSDELIDVQEGVRNILLVGLDRRPGEGRSRSDTMVIVTLDGNDNVVKLTSLMRDMYVNIPGHGNNRINAAYVFGGAELLLATIEENFGLHIDEYAAVDLTLVIDVVDELEGLVMNVENMAQLRAINGVIDAYNAQFNCPVNSDLLTETGEQLMNGKQVQAYARFRHTDNDFYRTQRQRNVLVALYEKIHQYKLVDLTLLASKYIDRVDTNLSLTDIVSMLPIVLQMDAGSIEQLRLPADDEYTARMISGMAVLVPDMEACRARLADFITAE